MSHLNDLFTQWESSPIDAKAIRVIRHPDATYDMFKSIITTLNKQEYFDECLEKILNFDLKRNYLIPLYNHRKIKYGNAKNQQKLAEKIIEKSEMEHIIHLAKYAKDNVLKEAARSSDKIGDWKSTFSLC